MRHHLQVRELTTELGEPAGNLRLPHGVLAGLRRHDQNVLVLLDGVVLREHQTHEGLAEADAIGQEAATPTSGSLLEAQIGISLVRGKERIDHRVVRLPLLLAGCHVLGENLQGLAVDLEW